ncbi:hypothetical protein P3T73_07665 [Kiritimatiellota bacterium B12222]|nr:hypothetical protein P3T73_07665 [Kiritimatiellota bacterium B12222]
MKPFALLCIMALSSFGLSACTKQYTSTALLEYSVRTDPLQGIDAWIDQQNSILPEGVTLSRLRQSTLLEVRSKHPDPLFAAQQANEVAINLETTSPEQGFSLKLVDAAVSSH